MPPGRLGRGMAAGLRAAAHDLAEQITEATHAAGLGLRLRRGGALHQRFEKAFRIEHGEYSV